MTVWIDIGWLTVLILLGIWSFGIQIWDWDSDFGQAILDLSFKRYEICPSLSEVNINVLDYRYITVILQFTV